MQNYKISNKKQVGKIQNTKFEWRNTKHEIQNGKCTLAAGLLMILHRAAVLATTVQETCLALGPPHFSASGQPVKKETK